MKNVKCLLFGIVATLMFAPALFAQEQKLEEGEILYRGVVKLEKCDEAIISFVLNAQKDSLKNITFEFNGIYIKDGYGNVRKVKSQNSYSVTIAVKDGVVDYTYPWRGENWRINITEGLGTEIVRGEVKCVYAVNRDQIEDLGTTPIEFKKAEPN